MAGGQVRRVSWPSWRVDVTVSFDSITTATSQKEEAAVVTRFIIFSSSHPAATIKCLPTPPTPCITRLTGRVNHPPPEESTNSRILLGVKKKKLSILQPERRRPRLQICAHTHVDRRPFHCRPSRRLVSPPNGQSTGKNLFSQPETTRPFPLQRGQQIWRLFSLFPPSCSFSPWRRRRKKRQSQIKSESMSRVKKKSARVTAIVGRGPLSRRPVFHEN